MIQIHVAYMYISQTLWEDNITKLTQHTNCLQAHKFLGKYDKFLCVIS